MLLTTVGHIVAEIGNTYISTGFYIPKYLAYAHKISSNFTFVGI